MTFQKVLFPLFSILLFAACGGEEPATPAEFRFTNDRTAFENASNEVFSFDVRIDEAKTEEVRVGYVTEDMTAVAGEDYVAASGTLIFAPGETTKTIDVTIIVDEYLEGDEQFIVRLNNPEGGYLRDNLQEAVGTIRNDDETIFLSDAGYTTPESYPGMTLVWGDEFNSNGAPDPSKWTYDLGNGNWGWGNNELQSYTNSPDNVTVTDGRLFIFARNEGSYTSARIKTQGIYDFQYGRVDIRAALPIGQGIWPALWMLGSDITTESWPACGEIDIMELVGHQPRLIHGTVHWGPDNGQHQYYGSTGPALSFPETFATEFHVFSIDWQEDEIKFYLDDVHYHTVTPSNMNGMAYPFNDAFFFIFNVAIGGAWPGDPNETTPFPGFMAVDYVRVFQ